MLYWSGEATHIVRFNAFTLYQQYPLCFIDFVSFIYLFIVQIPFLFGVDLHEKSSLAQTQ
eukprot:m.47602 g.47602  ORF g.47602 m.47602 type:complete len:60 (-) comp10986_c0_seq5:681-860(-)